MQLENHSVCCIIVREVLDMRKEASEKTIKLKLSTIELYCKIFGEKKVFGYKYSVEKIKAYNIERNTVGRIKSLKIEVRSSERPHNLAHFHVTSPGRGIDAVYTLDPIEYFKGEIDSKSNKMVLKWAEENKDVLINMWNDFHGYRIKVS